MNDEDESSEEDRKLARMLQDARTLGVKLRLTITPSELNLEPADRARVEDLRGDIEESSGAIIGRLVVWGSKELWRLEQILVAGSSATAYVDRHPEARWPWLPGSTS